MTTKKKDNKKATTKRSSKKAPPTKARSDDYPATVESVALKITESTKRFASEKHKAASLIVALNKDLGEGSAGSLEDNDADVGEVIPSGVSPFNHYLAGCGGFPVGRITEIFGHESSGKTALALSALGAAQREGGYAVLIETEHALANERAGVYGIDGSNLVLIQPDTLEEAFAAIYRTVLKIRTKAPSVIVWDSFAATAPKQEVEEGLSAKMSAEMGLRARISSQCLRVLTPLLPEHRVALIIINQLRYKVGVMFGNPETSPGGEALKMHASLRILANRGKQIKDGPDPTGAYFHFRAVKNKVAPPGKSITARLDFATGWNDGWSTLNHAKDFKLIPQNAQGQKATLEAYEKLSWPIPGEVPADPDPAPDGSGDGDPDYEEVGAESPNSYDHSQATGEA